MRVELFDVLGRRVGALHEGVLEAGQSVTLLVPAAIGAGVYVVRLSGTKGAHESALVRLR